MARLVDPQGIEEESFRIIAEEMGSHSFSELELPIVKRAIHASADFDFARTMVFSPGAVEAGLAAIRAGRDVVADVAMVAVGINNANLGRFGGRVHCFISDTDVVAEAKRLGVTRAIAAMRRADRVAPGGIIAIGNAPTALLEMSRLVRAGQAEPALIVGVPVGFVSAEAAKEDLLTLPRPYITNRGRKGGSSVAVAIVNALLLLALRGR